MSDAKASTSDKKIALVTGGTRGIGKAIVEGLAKSGNFSQIAFTGTDESKGAAAVAEYKKAGIDNVKFFVCDQSDEKSIAAAVEAINSALPRVDVLINNAGIAKGAGSILEAKTEDINATFHTNVIGPLKLCQAFVPKMRANKYGRIVNMSSGMGQLSDMNGQYFPYRVSKVSLNALTRTLAYELKDENILVNTMCPGSVKTDMNKGGSLTVEQGADTAVWLAQQPDSGARGLFFRAREVIPW